MEALAERFRVRPQRVMAILALKVRRAGRGATTGTGSTCQGHSVLQVFTGCDGEATG